MTISLAVASGSKGTKGPDDQVYIYSQLFIMFKNSQLLTLPGSSGWLQKPEQIFQGGKFLLLS